MLNISEDLKNFITNDFQKTPLTKAEFIKKPAMLRYGLIAPSAGVAKLVLGVAYLAIQVIKGLGEILSEAKEKKAVQELKFAFEVIADGLIKILPIVNIYAKLYQLDKKDRADKKAKADDEKAQQALNDIKASAKDTLSTLKLTELHKRLCPSEYNLLNSKIVDLNELINKKTLTQKEIEKICKLTTSISMASNLAKEISYKTAASPEFKIAFQNCFSGT